MFTSVPKLIKGQIIKAEGADIRERVSFPQPHYTSYDDDGYPTEEPSSPTESDLVPYEPMDLLGGFPDRWYGYEPRQAQIIECMHLLTAAGATANTERNSLIEFFVYSKPRAHEIREVIHEMIRTTDCDVNWGSKSRSHCTPLELALDNDMYDIVERLLDAGAVIGTHTFRHVVRYGTLEHIFLFLQHGVDPYSIDKIGRDAMECIRDQIQWSRGRYYYQEQQDAKNDRKLKFLSDLFECRRKFDSIKDDVHRELMEFIWNPQRLARSGYFSVEES